MFSKNNGKVLEKYEEHGIVLSCEGANFFGQESLKVKQVRGNGVLILTKEELIFEYWTSKRVLRIPKSKILGLEKTKWHLGKTKGVNLLKVRFTNEESIEDSAAWWVKNIEQWTQMLESIIQRNKK